MYSLNSVSIAPLSNEVLAVFLNESAKAIPLAVVPLAFVDASILIDIPSNSMGLLFIIELPNILGSGEQILAASYGPMHILFLPKYVFFVQVKIGI